MVGRGRGLALGARLSIAIIGIHIMSTYRCDSCNKTTSDVDDSPCGKQQCEKMQLIEIATIHYSEKINDKYTVVCKPSKNANLLISSSLVGVTCAKCLKQLKARTATTENKQASLEDWKSFNWEDFGYPADMLEKLQSKYESVFEMKSALTNQPLSFPEILTETEKEILIASLEL